MRSTIDCLLPLTADCRWKRTIEQKLQLMEEQISSITSNAATALTAETIPTAPSTSSATLYEAHSGMHTNTDTDSSADNGLRHQPAWEVVMDARLNPAAMPASCVSQLPETSPSGESSQGHRTDLISRGAISITTAERLFAIYKERLDHYVYGILADHDSILSIRAGSALLTAAVCAVAALHAADPSYTVCYDEFVKDFAVQSTSRNHTLDDVRGLCIGAFWLSDMSWTLAGTGRHSVQHFDSCNKH